MTRVLLDTNVVLDFLLDRAPFADAAAALDLAIASYQQRERRFGRTSEQLQSDITPPMPEDQARSSAASENA